MEENENYVFHTVKFESINFIALTKQQNLQMKKNERKFSI